MRTIQKHTTQCIITNNKKRRERQKLEVSIHSKRLEIEEEFSRMLGRRYRVSSIPNFKQFDSSLNSSATASICASAIVRHPTPTPITIPAPTAIPVALHNNPRSFPSPIKRVSKTIDDIFAENRVSQSYSHSQSQSRSRSISQQTSPTIIIIPAQSNTNIKSRKRQKKKSKSKHQNHKRNSHRFVHHHEQGHGHVLQRRKLRKASTISIHTNDGNNTETESRALAEEDSPSLEMVADNQKHNHTQVQSESESDPETETTAVVHHTRTPTHASSPASASSSSKLIEAQFSSLDIDTAEIRMYENEKKNDHGLRSNNNASEDGRSPKARIHWADANNPATRDSNLRHSLNVFVVCSVYLIVCGIYIAVCVACV